MPSAALIISLIALALTIVGLIIKLTTFMTEMRVYVSELRKDRPHVKKIPFLEYRVSHLEKHVGLSVPEMPVQINGSNE